MQTSDLPRATLPRDGDCSAYRVTRGTIRTTRYPERDAGSGPRGDGHGAMGGGDGSAVGQPRSSKCVFRDRQAFVRTGPGLIIWQPGYLMFLNPQTSRNVLLLKSSPPLVSGTTPYLLQFPPCFPSQYNFLSFPRILISLTSNSSIIYSMEEYKD